MHCYPIYTGTYTKSYFHFIRVIEVTVQPLISVETLALKKFIVKKSAHGQNTQTC